MTWSPHIFLAERFVNKQAINNARIPLVDRILTLEGPANFSEKEVVKSSSLLDSLEKACITVAKELSTPACGIRSFTLLFKQDVYDRLQLVLCSGLKLDSSQRVTVPRILDPQTRLVKYEVIINVTNLVDGSRESAGSRTEDCKINVREFKAKRCAMCVKKIESSELFEVNNKLLVEMHEFYHPRLSPKKTTAPTRSALFDSYFPQDTAGSPSSAGAEDEVVPSALANLYPGISYAGYMKRREDPVWQFESARVCSACWASVEKL